MSENPARRGVVGRKHFVIAVAAQTGWGFNRHELVGSLVEKTAGNSQQTAEKASEGCGAVHFGQEFRTLEVPLLQSSENGTLVLFIQSTKEHNRS
jgi:hypothetical protein